MLFHTWTFAAFFLVVLTCYSALRRTRWWLHCLFAASYIFYGWWNPYYLLLILYSTTLDFNVVGLMDRCPAKGARRFKWTHLFGAGIKSSHLRLCFALFIGGAVAALSLAVLDKYNLRPVMLWLTMILSLMALGTAFSSRRLWLAVSIINNLSLLLFFKYAGFVSENLNNIFARAGLPFSFPDAPSLMPFGAEYLLPVGISFFMFQSMSYTIDFYRGNIHREKSFIRFATFVSFFPQLVAGPIERAGHLLPQFNYCPKVSRSDLTEGASLFLVGLFKKLALANYISVYVERVYDDPAAFDAPALLLATFAFAWQIYFDFSGYTDMARGVARVFGFKLMLNFNHPYLAASLSEFWSRWHISLSTWFRDYVYIPLGGNRKTSILTYRNLLLTFIISGLWHGAAWTFIIWGALHGIFILITRNLEKSETYRTKVPKFIKQAAVFLFVCFAWIFFRADSLESANLIITRMFSTPWTSQPGFPLLMGLLIFAVWAYEYLSESRFKHLLKNTFVRILLATSMVIYLLLFSSKGGAFIYFQF
jgi:D-alanyl-lipoteichoic acid acyltransferase DltB (MBOAT superfamily)